MIDPVTLAAIRRLARELAVKPDDELAQLGALVAVLCDGLAEAAAETNLLLERLARLVELQAAQQQAATHELGLLRHYLEVPTDDR